MRLPVIQRFLLLSLLGLSACLSFGEDWTTTTPTPEQRVYALQFVGLDPQDKSIRVVGVHFLGSGIDSAIWLKLETPPEATPFSGEPLSHEAHYSYSADSMSHLPWWDPRGRQGTRYVYPVTSYRNANVFVVSEANRQVWYITSFEQ